MDFRHNLELDVWFRYSDSTPTQNIPHQITLDTRIGWEPCKKLELSVVGQNLLDPHHPEWSSDTFLASYPTQVERSVYGKITWRF
jgi:iron complex outermembrane receptor protein